MTDKKSKKIFNSQYIPFLKNNSDFLKLFIAHTFANIGIQMHRFGLPWIVFDLTGSAQLMAVNFTVSLVPGFFFGLVGGVLADRKNRKTIMISGHLISSILVALIVAVQFSAIDLTVFFLFSLTFALSSISAIYQPSFQSSIPTLVKKEDLAKANGLFSVTRSFIALGGPVTAGMIIGFLGPWTNLIINSITLLIAALTIYLIKSTTFSKSNTTLSPKKNSVLQDLVECQSVIRTKKWLSTSLILIFGVYLGVGSVGSLIQYFLREELGLSGQEFGLTFALFEFFPLLIMGYYAPVIAKKFKFETLLIFSSFIYALSLIGMGLTSNYFTVIISGMILNAAFVLIVVIWQTTMQSRLHNDVLGRISGVSLTVQSTALPIGGAISSALVAYVSAQWVFISFGFISLIFVLVIFSISYFKYQDKPNI